MSVDFDLAGVHKLSADLNAAGSKVAPLARKALHVTAGKVKDDAKELTSGSHLMPHLPSSIDYDMKAGPNHVEAEVGFERSKRQGKLGNIYEYGSRYFPARGPLAQALHQNEADFVKGMTIAAEDALGL